MKKQDFRSENIFVKLFPATLRATLILKASDGSITAWSLATRENIEARGDMTIRQNLTTQWTVQLPWYACATLPTGVGQGGFQGTPLNIDPCILAVDGDWQVFTDGFLNTVLNYSGDINEILWGLWDLSSTSNDNDIYFADPSGGVSANDVLVRIGIKKPGNANTTDAQLIVRNDIQTREAFTITKNPSNGSANDNLFASNQVGHGNISESRIEQTNDGKWMIFEQTTANGGWDGFFRFKWKGSNDIKVGINNGAPTEALDVVGNANISKSLNIGSNLHVNNNLNVDQQVKANTYLYNSDARYKSAITPLDNALDKILALNGYSYFNKLSQRQDIGVIAQEVEKIFPELVHTDKAGYKSVEYANLVAPLIEAVKELNDKVDSLEARLNVLEAK